MQYMWYWTQSATSPFQFKKPNEITIILSIACARNESNEFTITAQWFGVIFSLGITQKWNFYKINHYFPLIDCSIKNGIIKMLEYCVIHHRTLPKFVSFDIWHRATRCQDFAAKYTIIIIIPTPSILDINIYYLAATALAVGVGSTRRNYDPVIIIKNSYRDDTILWLLIMILIMIVVTLIIMIVRSSIIWDISLFPIIVTSGNNDKS